MKKGFTLLELMVVIIILGVLATLGVMQYQGAIEKSRGAEARQVIGAIRSQCAAIFMANGDTIGCGPGNLRIGDGADMIPWSGGMVGCRPTNYFSYDVAGQAGATLDITAVRCIANGKPPQATSAGTLVLAVDFSGLSAETWTSTGGY